MQIDISNKVIVVTGSSRGIGSEMIKCFAKENASIVINYNRSVEEATKLFKEIKKHNSKCIVVKADVTKCNEVRYLLDKTLEAFGRVDILINNAGICDDNLIPLMTEEKWKHVIDINLNSIFLCCKIFAKEMMKKKYGKIFNITSLKGQIGSEGQTNYSAAKAGTIGFTKALAKEIGSYNVSVNAISPGYIVTDLNRNNINKSNIANGMNVMMYPNSLNDLLNFMVFACSDHFQSVSGRVFNLDSRL
ncbi:SDR family NAD(P)-dependent oxidoreductase [Vallitalea sp.]|jgi:3-oxoacyl-[acyl-carrier protein] reductase|uniref:SDR family NAD(P)-dependent oxidoreductase n=1 Tax=Vallitalea sp. TaxID=1882829 RepID=UPI0025D3FFB8|nr:SDR family NAD(P)-dependent oxidoreductase [Vallitalea sp.]MCT4686739.1 SDR family NAD(P)-dependent oxidoreductase [Vallitalea sp.]